MPRLIIVAGVNGSGKSTLTQHNRFNNIRVIDPDAIAKQMSTRANESARNRAGREAIRLRREYLENGYSFVLETTLSGHTTARLMQQACRLGYQIELYYIYLIDEEQSVDRVATRVSKGGHHIPREDIERRFQRSRDNFETAALIAHKTIVYDNAAITETFQPVLVADEDSFEIDDFAPDWLVQAVSRIRIRAQSPDNHSRARWEN